MPEETSTKADWSDYYKVTSSRPVRELLRHTLVRFPEADNASRLAIDLGCGAGSETIALLNLGWEVVAIDQQADALAIVRSLVKPDERSRLRTQAGSFKDVELPPADFIWASFSLPFASPEDFPALWRKIVGSLKPGGRFAGDFFGPRHAWADRKNMNFHTAEQVRSLCDSLMIEYFISEEGEKITATSGPQHWHAYAIVAKKP